MFSLLRGLFGKKKPPPDPADYAFVVTLGDGTRRSFDPWDVSDKLGKALPDWKEKVGDLAAGAKPLPPNTSPKFAAMREERLAATERELTVAVGEVFDLPPLAPDGSGYTRRERLEVLGLWVVWSGTAVETARPLPGGGDGTGVTSVTSSDAPSPPANASA